MAMWHFFCLLWLVSFAPPCESLSRDDPQVPSKWKWAQNRGRLLPSFSVLLFFCENECYFLLNGCEQSTQYKFMCIEDFKRGVQYPRTPPLGTGLGNPRPAGSANGAYFVGIIRHYWKQHKKLSVILAYLNIVHHVSAR